MVAAALGALGRAGERALPTLRDAALQGNVSMKWSAVSAIGTIGGATAVKICSARSCEPGIARPRARRLKRSRTSAAPTRATC